jgi:hypothetical protein
VLPDEPLPDFAALERRLVESEAAARQLFDELCPPAAAASTPGGQSHEHQGR